MHLHFLNAVCNSSSLMFTRYFILQRSESLDKMREIYVNVSTNPISVIPLSTNSGIALNAVWKERKGMWYVFGSARKELSR